MNNLQWLLVSALLTLSAGVLQGCSSAHEMKSYAANQALDLRDDDNDGVINSRDICADTPLTSEIDLSGCSQWRIQTKNEDIVFEFAMDKSALLSEHEQLVNSIIQIVAQKPDAEILLVGDTSPEGSDEYNRALGQRRANTVIDELIICGVNPDRIIGFVYTDALPQALLHKRLRRTIVRILYNQQESIPKWNIYTVEQARGNQ